jgi:CheY-specific phosphatase CheX
MPNPQPNPNRPTARTAPTAPPKDLRAQYNLAPVPSSVDQIAGLVKGTNSEMREITRIINRDTAVTQRCMITAYPKAEMRENATLDMATTRLGLGRVISLIVGDLLQQAVIETFRTMVGLEMTSEDPVTMPTAPTYFIGTARFKGRASGDVLLAFPPPFERFVTAQILGGSPQDKWEIETIHDTLGELVNIVTGNLQSRLTDAGLPSDMGLPVVKQQTVFPTVTILGGSSDRFYFVSGEHSLGVNLCISPFAKEPLKQAR